MNPAEFPTKGNLIQAKNSLNLSLLGYDLMEKKRNILVNELMKHIDEANELQEQIQTTFTEAYLALQKANIHTGINNVLDTAHGVPIDNSIKIKTRSIMGTEIPLATGSEGLTLSYSFYGHDESLDACRAAFTKVKQLTLRLASVENSAYRLAENINKTRKRANALKNITIPYFKELTANITNALEEKEREEFTRLKVIKKRL